MTSERIILTVEIIEDCKEASTSRRVLPDVRFLDSTCAGEWFENAIQEMRSECKAKLKETNTP